MGLWAFSAVRIVAATFFALQDTRTPLRMAGISILANIVLGVVLMKPLAHSGLALATSLASMLNLGLLLGALRIRLGFLGWKSIALSVCRSLLCSVIMGIAVRMAAFFMVPDKNSTLPGLLGGVVGSIAVGLCIYGAGSYMIKSPELSRVLVEAGKGIGKK
jgi:putative peptidoglycan lipid II flippase